MSKADEARKAAERDADKREIKYEEFESHMVPVGTRLPEDQKRALERYFIAKGLKLGQGVRLIISEYIQRERIR